MISRVFGLKLLHADLVVNSTFLNGNFKGQLATACAGHNWMYPVASGVSDSKLVKIGPGS
jgi:hypothetical protein